LEAFCSVNASDDAAIIPEASGKVTKVFVSEDDLVKKGQKLFAVENTQQRVAVSNAQLSLKSAELSLSELLQNNDTESDSSILAQTTAQQETLVANARNAYLNTDVRAYPEKYDEDSPSPIISGNYTCDTEGVYELKIYASGSKSGASGTLSGLETGRVDISNEYPAALGSCGLEIVFPKEFNKSETWTIAIPNTRSGAHFAAKKAYESALSGKNIVLNNTQASPEQIARERARVNQAKLQLQSAYETLAKATVTAPVAGYLSGFEVKKGDFINTFSESGRVKSIGDLELVAYVNDDEKKYIKPFANAVVANTTTQVTSVASAIDAQTKKVKVTLSAPKDVDLVEGTQVACQIERSVLGDAVTTAGEGVVVPLSAVSIIGQKSYVFIVENNMTKKHEVDTGALLGADIVVYGLDSGEIIRDARGIREGQILSIIEKE
ncbi:MAG: efflux RND transporter periplasmic adaptor subunit, partial [Minisyncoccia bacterium]